MSGKQREGREMCCCRISEWRHSFLFTTREVGMITKTCGIIQHNNFTTVVDINSRIILPRSLIYSEGTMEHASNRISIIAYCRLKDSNNPKAYFQPI